MAEIRETKELWDEVTGEPAVVSTDGKLMRPEKIYIRYAKYGTDRRWSIDITVNGTVIKKDNTLGTRAAKAVFSSTDPVLPLWVSEYIEKYAPKELTDSGELWANGKCLECGDDSGDSEFCEACTDGS